MIVRHFVLLGRPEVDARLALDDELIDSARRSGDRDALVHVLLRRHDDCKEVGDRPGADAALGEYEAVDE